MAMLETIVGLFLIMLLIIILIIVLSCRPWRFLSSSYPYRAIKADDLERPLIREEFERLPTHRHEPAKSYTPEEYSQTDGHFTSVGSHGLTCKQRICSPASHLTQGGSLILDIGDPSEDVLVGQTLKRPSEAGHSVEEEKHVLKEDRIYDLKLPANDVRIKGSSLTLEVTAGPSRGLRHSLQSTDASKLPLTLGRNPPSDLLLKDLEVSGKHAMIKWNLNKLKWELVDMGSLNGTLLNSKAVHHPDYGSRHWGEPVELASGDIITLGTISKIQVHIASLTECDVPLGIGIASDAMYLRRGAKQLPMEDVCYYQLALSGIDQFGIFGICDGHGGAGAAKAASKIIPEEVANILSDSLRREEVLSQQDASDVLKEAFSRTEKALTHLYEGCTATVLLVWTNDYTSYFAQCANVGDSACVMNISGNQITMTEDHRITSYSERQRINKSGVPLRDGDTRLCGLNLGRMLGDKFLKEQDERFSSEPFISQAVHIDPASEAFALLASDGLWDVMSVKKAVQLVIQARERYAADGKGSAEEIANFLLNEARNLRTRDNTSILYLDFNLAFRGSCKYDS